LKLGYAVRKGERAIRIWVPVPPSKAKLEAWKESSEHPDDRPRTFFKLSPVFDRSQTSPLPPPASPAPLEPPIASVEGDELAWAMNPLTAFAGALGSEVEFEAMPTSHGGYYEIGTCRIALNERHSVNGQVKTLIHELTHALLRAEPQDDDPALSYAEEELVVESVAYTVCGSVGLDVTGYAIPYLACWSEVASIETIQASAVLIDRHARRLEDVVAAGRPSPETSEAELKD
jgi:antirestriction protein ArdC